MRRYLFEASLAEHRGRERCARVYHPDGRATSALALRTSADHPKVRPRSFTGFKYYFDFLRRLSGV